MMVYLHNSCLEEFHSNPLVYHLLLVILPQIIHRSNPVERVIFGDNH